MKQEDLGRQWLSNAMGTTMADHLTPFAAVEARMAGLGSAWYRAASGFLLFHPFESKFTYRSNDYNPKDVYGGCQRLDMCERLAAALKIVSESRFLIEVCEEALKCEP